MAYFEVTDKTRKAVNIICNENPEVDFDTIYNKFFAEYKDPVPIWTISGRHAETAACKSVMVMLKGKYNDYFKADEHYISVEKDFSNMDEVMEKFRDDSFCSQLTENSYEAAMTSLTYEKLISRLHLAEKLYKLRCEEII